jgi:hypothetical protein
MFEFKDLLFEPHPNASAGFDKQAEMEFDNGYGISVINGTNAYVRGSYEWEIAVLKNGNLCYDTPITDDVIGHQTADEVTEIMKQIQELPQAEKPTI